MKFNEIWSLIYMIIGYVSLILAMVLYTRGNTDAIWIFGFSIWALGKADNCHLKALIDKED